MRVMKIDIARSKTANIDGALRMAMRSDYDCVWFYGFKDIDIVDYKKKVVNSGIKFHSGNRPPPVPSTFRAKQVIDEMNLL